MKINNVAFTFAGQGTSWQETLREVTQNSEIRRSLEELMEAGKERLAPLGRELKVVIGQTFTLDSLLEVEAENVAASLPGIVLAQYGVLLELDAEGFEFPEGAPAVGHSQGVLGAALYRAWCQSNFAEMVDIYALAELLGATVTEATRACGARAQGGITPMLAVMNVSARAVKEIIQDAGLDARVSVALENSLGQVVLAGRPEDLESFIAAANKVAAQSKAQIDAKERGGRPFSPQFQYLRVGAPFHSPLLVPALERTRKLAADAGISSDLVEQLAPQVLTLPCSWTEQLQNLESAEWIVDIGPGVTLANLNEANLLGSGIESLAVGTASARDALLGSDTLTRSNQNWGDWAPKVATLNDGKKVLTTAFTKLTGRSPILLAGMTPTTVDPQIVAAAANAGYWAELAGGGQVTEAVFAKNLSKLKELLHPGKAAQFNAMFLDPYLWNLQFGTQSIVTKARAGGAPLDGVVISAGIPEEEDAVRLVKELQEAGFPYVAFKPGTTVQIRQVVKIAALAHPLPVIIQVEDGHAGGHHSWENLDDLLLETYAEIRQNDNLILCVGGGIGTPERAADYLSGQWSQIYGRPLMPVDGVLIGTAAMTAKEAKTSAEVKELLVATSGIENPITDHNNGWVGAGTSRAGIASGQSHLRADIHEIDNAAAACARLIAEVSGQEDQVLSRRDEIIEAMAATAKPYFGDVDKMTYWQWAKRFADLCISPFEEDTLEERWADITWAIRFQHLLQRLEGRLSKEQSGAIPTIFPSVDDVLDADSALERLLEQYPEAKTTEVTPTDAAWFVDLCRQFPKPMPFVPVLDADLLRWWGQDNLWQSQDARYGADQVRIIPGPVSVAGITTVNEPISDILGRFEEAAIQRVQKHQNADLVIFSRFANAQSKTQFVAQIPFISWSGNLIDNPATVLQPRSYSVNEAGDLVIELDTAWDHIEKGAAPHAVRSLTIPLDLDSRCENGGYPVVDRARLPQAMYTLLAQTAGVGGVNITGDPIEELPQMIPSVDSVFGEAHFSFTVTSQLANLHRGTTGEALGAKFNLSTWVPDALLGMCWPAIYAALGSALLEDGFPVIEGLLSAVHLDHMARVDVDLEELLSKNDALKFTVVARTVSVEESSAGRIVTVKETLFLAGKEVGFFQERFAIRGRINSDALPKNVARAAGLAKDVIDTPRSVLRRAKVKAPADMTAFANVSGDFNPIHTSRAAAQTAGLEDALVHGMWLSAVAQNLVQAELDGQSDLHITGWTYNMYGLVNLNDLVDITVERVGRLPSGGLLLEVTCKVDGQVVSKASATTAGPITAYVYPGQGIQQTGMGLDEMRTSPAARDVWERADRLTRQKLGFSIITLVRDNPTQIQIGGKVLRHPEGVLNLTQFTQVALATVAFAQTARLSEMGALVQGAYFAGHSLGEYNALAAYGEVFDLESVLEIVFYRGTTMHNLVPRDEDGRSNYRMGALRPNQFGVDHSEVEDYVESIAKETGEFLQIVNFNLSGQQYAIAGTVKGLAALEADATAKAEAHGGKRPFMYVPGVDVPFHSSVLRQGVDEFRDKLETLIPQVIPASRLIGKYIPNLVAKPFEVSAEFARTITEEVPSKQVAQLLEGNTDWEGEESRIARTLLIELLCWQFASPVRWIQTQELLLAPLSEGGLGVSRLIEIGLGNAPTLAGLGEKTLQLQQFATSRAMALNLQRDEQIVTCVDVAFVEDETNQSEEGGEEVSAKPAEAQLVQAEPVQSESAQPVPAPSATLAQAAPVQQGSAQPAAAEKYEPVADISFSAADAIHVLIAFQNKLRPEQIEGSDTTDTLTAGVSARRNQLLMDLSAELGLPSIDGAADASIAELASSVNKLAPHYRPFGPILTDAIRERMRKVFGGAGLSLSFIQERLKDTWKLGEGWIAAVTAEILLGTREGDSARGGVLAVLPNTATSRAEAESIVDAAVKAAGISRGQTLTLPSSTQTGGGVVDSAALDAYRAQMTQILSENAQELLKALGVSDVPAETGTQSDDAWIAQTVEAELGPRWVEMVSPRFDAAKAVLLDDRWASAREDLARIGHAGKATDTDPSQFAGLGADIAGHALWWANNSSDPQLANFFREVHGQALTQADLPFSGQVALVTGMAPTSIASGVVAELLRGGAQVIATASRIDSARLNFAKELYRNNARAGAALWLVPANLSSYRDVDSLIDWIGSKQEKNEGGVTKLEKPALVPDLFFPFAAPSVSGTLEDSGQQFESQTRLLLWSVERAIAKLSALAQNSVDNRKVHVVLPGSPNRGIFGGDGAYGETKASFDALANRWAVEPWAGSITIAHPLIGWVQGTGLMGGNDVLIPQAKEAGVKVYDTAEIASELLALCTAAARQEAEKTPLQVDLTGGLGVGFDIRSLKEAAAKASENDAGADTDNETPVTISALPTPTRTSLATTNVETWGETSADLENMVVVVGIGEVGPWGSSRTRWQAELGMQVDGEVDLTPAGVLELAWMTGLLTWEESPVCGWRDQEGNLVEPGDVYDRYRDEVVARSGIRSFITDAGIIEGGSEEDAAVFLDKDVTFTVDDEKVARSYVEADSRFTTIRPLSGGEWEVTKLAGATARLPRRATLSRTVGGQFPTGFDPAKWGLSPSLMEGMDRIAAWNLVSAVDAFLGAGFSPAELLQAVHPGDVASTQGTGFGGMTSMRKLFVDRFLGEEYPADILQETLPNVVAAHTMQSYIGGYGPMVQPVSACATAAVSVEDGVDKIRAGKAKFVVAGAIDDLSVESVVGFGSMNATANSEVMAGKGISERFYSRANDRRRGGFIESQGGGTVLLARADLAAELGLPVLAVVAYAQSFSDGINTSIPAPGKGALGAGRGGTQSRLAKSLESIGISADEIGFVSKHDTSTGANDPNESQLHTRLAKALGRTEGNPLYVVSQKSLTGHAKGGACVFQISGVSQIFRDEVLPGNIALDCVDEELADNPWLVWLRSPLQIPAPKAALITSLGFGHVSALLALAHPGAFEAVLFRQGGAEVLHQWRTRALERMKQGARDLESGMLGRSELFVPVSNRRLPAHSKDAEAQMLLDPNARLGMDGEY